MTETFVRRNSADTEKKLEAEQYTRDSEDYYLPRTTLVPPGYTTKFAYDGSDNLEYIGLALPGAATSVASWQVRKITYSGSNPTAIEWADGDRTFDNVWDDRASLSYS